jgi:hypothetical protein
VNFQVIFHQNITLLDMSEQQIIIPVYDSSIPGLDKIHVPWKDCADTVKVKKYAMHKGKFTPYV